MIFFLSSRIFLVTNDCDSQLCPSLIKKFIFLLYLNFAFRLKIMLNAGLVLLQSAPMLQNSQHYI